MSGEEATILGGTPSATFKIDVNPCEPNSRTALSRIVVPAHLQRCVWESCSTTLRGFCREGLSGHFSHKIEEQEPGGTICETFGSSKKSEDAAKTMTTFLSEATLSLSISISACLALLGLCVPLPWKKGKDPHPQDKNQHLDFTEDPRPLYYKTPPFVFCHKNVPSKAVCGP